MTRMTRRNKYLQILFHKPAALLAISACIAACSDENQWVNEFGHKSKINDTGITWGGNYPKDINADCTAIINHDRLPEGDSVEGDILPEQDCTHGRDISDSDNGNGAAGFIYQKINANGEKVAADAKEWHCVLDEITGLLWEVKQPGDGKYGNNGLHDADDLYTYYNSNINTNGGAVGDWNSKYNLCFGYTEGKPMTYCNIGEYVSRVNKKGWCGYKDWRVPTQSELVSLVNFGRTMPAIDTAYFPNTQNQLYWSNSPTAGYQTTAWAVSFQFGYSANVQRTNSRPIRLVRNWTFKPEESLQ